MTPTALLLGPLAEFRKLGPHTIERNDHQKEKEEVCDRKHPRWEIIKEQLVKPIGDEAVLVQWSGAVPCAKRILPDGEGQAITLQAFDI
jgi:hypothetical protein